MVSSRMPAVRQRKILTWLQEEGSLSIVELEARLGVSHMTIHRDLDQLAQEGSIRKVRGGAVLSQPSQEQAVARTLCAMCKRPVTQRQEFIIFPIGGEQLRACCPHCGIMLLNDIPAVGSCLTRDYLYGHMVNVYEAFYVTASAVRLCCEPTVLCFARKEDADSFRNGFGGAVMSFSRVTSYLTGSHRMTNE